MRGVEQLQFLEGTLMFSCLSLSHSHKCIGYFQCT